MRVTSLVMALDLDESKSLSWIHTGKPSETDSPLYFLEGPKKSLCKFSGTRHT
jgi:hypothetical protein